jgi:hypothetical protein
MKEIRRVHTPYSYSAAVAAGDYAFLGTQNKIWITAN